MPEKDAKPKFVEVTLDLEYVEDLAYEEDRDIGELFWELQIDEYFHGES